MVHILSPETDNGPPWISGRERMPIENVSWLISIKECCWLSRGQSCNLLITSGMPIQLSNQGQHQSAELAQRVVKVRITPHEKFSWSQLWAFMTESGKCHFRQKLWEHFKYISKIRTAVCLIDYYFHIPQLNIHHHHHHHHHQFITITTIITIMLT